MIDGRIVTPAIGAWLGAAGVLWVAEAWPGAGWHRLLVWGVIGLGLAAFALSPRRLRLAVAGAALAATAGTAAAAQQVDSFTSDPAAGWVHDRATAVVEAVVTGDAVRRDPPPGSWQPARTQVTVRAVRISARGRTVALDWPLLVQGPLGLVVADAGSTVHLRGRLGPAPRADTAAVLTLAGQHSVRVIHPPGPVDAAANAMRRGLRASLTSAPQAGAGLVAGLAVGDESLLSADLVAAMRATGLAHLTAVSGGNVAILLAVVLGLAGILRWRLIARVGAAGAALAFFVVLVRPEPSVVRAAVMGAVAVVAMLTGGRRPGPSVLATAVLIVAVVAPLLAVSWGFALSAFATAGLVLLAPALAARMAQTPRLARWPPALREALAITGAAQLATVPILVAMGAAVGPASLPANLLAMPAVAPVTILGLAAAACAPLAPGVAAVLAWAAAWPAAWIAVVAERCSALPLAALPLPQGRSGVAVLLLAGLATLVAVRLRRRFLPAGLPPVLASALTAGTVSIAILLMLLPPGRRGWPPVGWVLVMCDVGQGVALAVRSGDDAAVVVDAGPDPTRVDRCLDDLGTARVDAVVLSHFHADHAGGLAGVGRDRPVAAAFVTTVDDPPEQAADAFAWFAQHGVLPSRLSAGSSLRIGEAEVQVRWPPATARPDPNNASLVLLVASGGLRMLLTGDIEAAAQGSLIAAGGLHADVVVIPHHGSPNQDDRLPVATGARLALVSVGAGNDYGHPSPTTVAAWAGQALVARTDEQGDLAVVRQPDGGLGLVTRGG